MVYTYYMFISCRKLLTQAVREVVEPIGAALAIFSGKVLLAGTLSAAHFAYSPGSPVGETVARLAVGVVVVSFAAGVTVRRLVLLATLALARAFFAVARRVEHVAVAA